jgi:cytochrome c-type biogenesis protein
MLMVGVTWMGAGFAGLISFFSPCILPLVPAFMAFVTGVSLDELKTMSRFQRLLRVGPRALAFVAGLGAVFVALGATATTAGRAISIHFDKLAVAAGLLLIALGLHMLGLLRLPLLMREWRLGDRLKPDGVIGAFIVGLAFGFGWTPCVGPVLAAILLAASQQASAGEGALLLLAYAAGMGVPFLLVAAFLAEAAGTFSSLSSHAWLAEKIAGTVILITGILIASGWMGPLATYLYTTFPVFQVIG